MKKSVDRDSPYSRTLQTIVATMEARHGVLGRVWIADRGMISAATIAALEKAGLAYILGVRERSTQEVRNEVIEDDGVAVPLVIPRQKGETQFAVAHAALPTYPFPRFRSLALFGRRPHERGDRYLTPTTENLAQSTKHKGHLD